MEEHPAAAQTLRQYASVLARIVAPFAPGTARRHGYRSVSHDFFHTLDRLDEDIPGRDRNWSARWRLRSRKGGCEGGGTVARAFSREGTVGDVGAGFATAAVVLAAGVVQSSHGKNPVVIILLFYYLIIFNSINFFTFRVVTYVHPHIYRRYFRPKVDSYSQGRQRLRLLQHDDLLTKCLLRRSCFVPVSAIYVANVRESESLADAKRVTFVDLRDCCE